jgi:vacuolar-type H+-ATPase subunit C/Vma6
LKTNLEIIEEEIRKWLRDKEHTEDMLELFSRLNKQYPEELRELVSKTSDEELESTRLMFSALVVSYDVFQKYKCR